MPHILITAGPTREYLDPVRYLSNASSGRMGAALAVAAVEAGHRVTLVTGPVEVDYPAEVEVIPVVSTQEMLTASQRVFPTCDGLIAAAAPCDYRVESVAAHKIRKTSGPLRLELIETPDIVASLAADKTAEQWIVAFALETEDRHIRAMQKLERKRCDLIVLNGPEAIHSGETRVEILDKNSEVVGEFTGDKTEVAKNILEVIRQQMQPQ